MDKQTNGTAAAIKSTGHDFSVFAHNIARFQRPRGQFLH